jgi:two-component sensor histidine kinase
MKYKINILAWPILLLLPLFANSQKAYTKAAITLKTLGLNVDSNLNLPFSQAKQLMSVWDSLYDIGKKIHITNTLSDPIWLNLLEQEIERAKAQKDTKTLHQLNYYKGHIYHSQKLFSKSIPIQVQLIQSSQDLTNNQLQKTLAKLEKAYIQTNDLEKALAVRKIRLNKGFIIGSYDIYQDFELHELALKEFLIYENKKPLKIANQYKFFRVLGTLYLELENIDSARKYFKAGLDLAQQNLVNENQLKPTKIHLHAQASFKGYLGRCYMMEGNYPKAIQLLEFDIRSSENDENNKIFKMIHLANCYLQINESHKVASFIKTLSQLTLDKEDKRMLIRLSALKAAYYQQINQFDSAYLYANQYILLKDIQTESIRKFQAILLLSNIEIDARKKDLIITKVNLEKEKSEKKAQLAFLWATIIVAIMASVSLVILFVNSVQKTRSRLLIEKKNEENEVLLKELHHRVKNNLQVIYSLINLQKRRLETPELNQSLSMVQNRIKTMSLVHQNLHENESFKEVNLASYIKTISDYLLSLYLNEEKDISIQLNIDSSIEMAMDRSITMGLLMNEIISNSLKYAFKGRASGLISIELQRIQDGFQMKLSDDGNGFNPADIKTKSLGMYLIKNLVKQIQGRYEIENFNGTTYIIFFKA